MKTSARKYNVIVTFRSPRERIVVHPTTFRNAVVKFGGHLDMPFDEACTVLKKASGNIASIRTEALT